MHARVAQVIQAAGITFQIRLHADLGEIRSPDDFAKALGYDLRRISKTLLLRANDEDRFFLVVAPIKDKIDLKKVAELSGVRRLQMASRDELQSQLGYPPNGVCPLGAQGLPIYMVAALLTEDTILIGAGVTGEEIELKPRDLQLLIQPTLI